MAEKNTHSEVSESFLPSPVEIELMADVLVARLGAKAADIAMFFANEQKALGDIDRFEAWSEVACIIHNRREPGQTTPATQTTLQ